MNEFDFSEAELMLQSQVKEFTNKEIKPRVKELSALKSFPYELCLRLGEMGYLGVTVPEEYGGQGLGSVSGGIVLEELARGYMACGDRSTLANTFYSMLATSDPDKLKDYFPAVPQGKHLVVWALSEPDCGTDAAAIKMTAVKDGNSYILNGEKTPITWAMQDYLKTIVVFAKTDPSKGAKGVSAFLVPADTPGLSYTDVPFMGWRQHTSGQITFQDVRVPAANMVGKEGEGFYATMKGFDFIRVMLAMDALAIARTALDETIDYARSRNTFGKPIAKYEAISFKLVEDISMLEMTRNYCYRTLRMRDAELNHNTESAISKWTSVKLAIKIVRDCMAMQGWIGYSEETRLPNLLADVLGFQFADGTAEAQKIVIARNLLGREFIPY